MDNEAYATQAYIIAQFETAVSSLMDELEEGRITAVQFRERMGELIASYHNWAWVSGQQDQILSPAAESVLNGLIAAQLAFLAGFVHVIRSAGGNIGPYINRFRARGKSYAGAVKTAWQHGDIVRQVGRVLPLPAMPTQGTQCHNNCGCNWRIVTIDAENGDYDAYWEREKDDSCQTCLERERLWNGPNGDGSNPVKIRNGRLMPLIDPGV